MSSVRFRYVGTLFEYRQRTQPTKKSKKKVIIRSIPLPGAVKKVTVVTQSLYAVFYDGLDKRGSSAIAMIGEVKSGGDGVFSAAEKGQLVDVTTGQMSLQPFRHTVIVFLTDGRRFQYFRYLRQGNDFRFEYSSIFLN